MAQTTVIGNDAEITGAATDWPLLVYDAQVRAGTMMLWDPSIDAQWPTGVIGGPVLSGSIWKNLGENFADGTQAGGTPPAYTAAGMFPTNTSSSIVWPTGLFDLPPLGYPDFTMTVWGRTPAAPINSLAQLIAGYGTNTTTLVGVYGAFATGGTTMNIGPRMLGQGQSVAVPLDAPFCASMSCTNAGGATRRIRTFVNNVAVTDVTVTPSTAAAPTQRLSIGEGGTIFDPFNGGVIGRVIMENCAVSGIDPETARLAEWTAQHQARGL